MKKEFGQLTPDQFSEFIGILPDLFGKIRDLGEHLAQVPASKFDAVMADDYSDYCLAYEMSLHQHLAALVVAMNRQGELHEMASAPDPQEEILKVLRRRDEDEEDKPQHEAFSDATVISLAYSVLRTMQSMATYGRSISSLLRDVRDNNNQDSLFKAIRMDRAVIGCPTVMKHIAKAQLRDNKAFFKKLRSALSGPSKKEWAGLDQMRYAMLMLREMGIDDLSEAALEELMVDKLQVYPRGGDAKKALGAHYRHSRKIPTI